MDRLRTLRESRGIKQKDLAELLDVSIVTIARYENGTREPSNANLVKLADYFGVTTDYLLGRVPMEANIIHGEPPPKREDEHEAVIDLPGCAPDVEALQKLIAAAVDAELKKRGL